MTEEFALLQAAAVLYATGNYATKNEAVQTAREILTIIYRSGSTDSEDPMCRG